MKTFTGPQRPFQILYQNPDALTTNSRNARKHPPHQIRKLAEAIKVFGFNNPVLVDSGNTVVAGHCRLAAALQIGLSEIPTIRLEHLTDDEIRAYLIADNKLAELGKWDLPALAIELQHLSTIQSSFDVTTTGFEIGEVDVIIGANRQLPKDDSWAEETAGPPVTQTGDVWSVGRHKIVCGSALEEKSYQSVLGTNKADAIFADPPYNLKLDGNVCGHGSIHHREFAMGSGEMSDAQFLEFLTQTLRLLSRHGTPESVHFVCIDWRHVGDLLNAGKQAYDALLNICVWVKSNGAKGSFYRSRHEFVLVFRNAKGRHRNNIQLGKFGRNRTNVWEYAGGSMSSQRTEEGNLLALHPTVKPVALVEDALLDCTARGESVLDAFLGSGTTLIAAEKTGRTCYGIEIDPAYVDVAVRRWQRFTGDQATHASIGKCFDDLALGREAFRERDI